MPVKVVMPEMGEGVTDATIIQWLVKEGDSVEEYQALVEVNTDKVDSEVPSPASGTVLKIIPQADEVVPVDNVLCWIGEPGEAIPEGGASEPAAKPATSEDTPNAEERPTPQPEPAPAALTPAPAPASAPTGSTLSGFVSPLVARMATDLRIDLSRVPGTGNGGRVTKTDVLRYVQSGGRDAPPVAAPTAPMARGAMADFISPVVARLAGEHRINLQAVLGTGKEGRITRNDIQRVIDNGGTDPLFVPGAAAPARISTAPPPGSPAPNQPQPGTTMKLDTIRRSIARHMVESKHTSPHVTTIMEADMSAVAAHRAMHKTAFAQDGAKLTFTAYFVSAVVTALKTYPIVNSSWSDGGILVHKDINVGMATALDESGLIVPVIKQADGLSLLGIARAINDLADRARNKQLKPDEVRGGTFTITNHGTSGSLFATPIINQPQCAILGTGIIQKRAIVINDAIAIRPMAYIGLTFDHRMLDGAVADYFLGAIKRTLEEWQ
jgi:2-oxoglutarate dehydrogenase E2 component (dihydrolipoamide succinyltransferase)